jgi:hypothetical protein
MQRRSVRRRRTSITPQRQARLLAVNLGVELTKT